MGLRKKEKKKRENEKVMRSGFECQAVTGELALSLYKIRENVNWDLKYNFMIVYCICGLVWISVFVKGKLTRNTFSIA